jgi:Transglutaminase-like enzymes, putative cysteine proteases
MRYAVTHRTRLEYSQPVRLAQFNLRLRPAAWPGQVVTDYALTVKPAPHRITERSGGYHVNETRFSLRESTTRLQIDSSFVAEREALPFFVFDSPGPALSELRERAMKLPDLSALAPASYIYASPIAAPEGEIAAWAGRILNETMPVMEAGKALMHAIHEEFAFDSGVTKVDTPPLEAFRRRHGVCQDFSHIMIVAARSQGIPAAYVSGYLRTLPPPGKERLVGADAMHAWVNLWCGEELGWVGFDPTNAALADVDHIFIGMGRDYSDVAPLDGTFRGSSQQTMFVSVDVAPVD